MAYKMTSDLSLKSHEIDHELLHHVLMHIHTEKPINGGLLVFLPGYDDILEQYQMIEDRFIMTNYRLFILHSSVIGASNEEQTTVFDPMPQGIRKIILSTNIAETSITINDVVSFRVCFAFEKFHIFQKCHQFHAFFIPSIFIGLILEHLINFRFMWSMRVKSSS